eukprot:TRINITY_DN4932_c0_g1_i4.p1 TRINITY_DN4932_c0_g1~~TRINITY_DN4932_c0_g1_i4.p1  ORF type:complete len:633 (-),score=71.36 TRINITY_DN4932_c0_g1_i4:60-1958(-)
MLFCTQNRIHHHPGMNPAQDAVATQVSNAVHVGIQRRTTRIEDNEELFSLQEPQVREDILRMIMQYLQDEGYNSSVMTLQDEANIKMAEQVQKTILVKKMRKLILEGDWGEVEKLCAKNPFKHSNAFLYAVYKQVYLELLERQEYQKAFTYLTKRLKPLEARVRESRGEAEGTGTTADEFRDLCYLLTCRTVQDAPSFKNWDGSKGTSREQLVEQFQAILDADRLGTVSTFSVAAALPRVPPHRLVTLMRQAVAYQIEFAPYHPKVVPRLTTLLRDYSCLVLPNALKGTFSGHRKNVKSLIFVGQDGDYLASGSSDNTVRIWDVDNVASVAVSPGHNGRIWDLASAKSGRFLASAAGDGTVSIWDLQDLCNKPRGSEQQKGPAGPVFEDGVGMVDRRGGPVPDEATLPRVCSINAHEGDAYGVAFHPGQTHIASAGYDKAARLWDARTGRAVKSFVGHTSSVSTIIFNPHGNMVISGGKDCTVKFWDIRSGLCVRTLASHLGEVTCVNMDTSGGLLLSSSKDNSNRLWDLRVSRPIKRFKGHQNTSKNFIRSYFGPSQSLIIGGSEDGFVYIWDIETANILQRLGGHHGVVYSAVWNPTRAQVATCSHDGTVKTWWYDSSRPVYVDGTDPAD